MGVDFAQRFVKYCSEIKDVPVKGVTKIESNPEQSKHLETARTTVLGSEIDFVNLRSEEYAVDSRIPTQVVIYFSLAKFQILRVVIRPSAHHYKMR